MNYRTNAVEDIDTVVVLPSPRRDRWLALLDGRETKVLDLSTGKVLCSCEEWGEKINVAMADMVKMANIAWRNS